MKRSSAWVSLLTVACRWGGPDGDPGDLFGPWPPPGIERPEAAAERDDLGAVDERTPAETGEPSATTEPAGSTGSIREAGPAIVDGVGVGARDSSDDVVDGAPDDAGSPPRPAPASCTAPAGLLCDPVSNAGCLPLTQCVIDPNASTAAAHCVIASFSLDPACTQDLLSTSCPPEHTCIAGQCREYCYCDADCDDGATCDDPSGQGGSDAFKLCAHEP